MLSTRSMIFNFHLYCRMAARSFRESRATAAPLTRKRLIFLFLFYTIFPVLAIAAHFGFLLDELIFPAYRKQAIEKPLFILGNLRSGSTFLHRLLSRDTTFTSLRTCDIFLAPSIIQRWVFRLLARADGLFGGLARKALHRLDAISLGKVPIHRVGLFAPEEDEIILFFAWSSFFLVFLFPFLDELPPYQFFDTALPLSERQPIMNFYRSCVQRHLYATGGHHFLAKNPAFSPKIETLLACFPDARIVYLVRNPLDMLPSIVSWLSYAWRVFGDPAEKYPHRDQILALTKYWYEHPLRVLDANPAASHLIVNFDDLVRSPDQVIAEIYRRFDYPQTSQLEQVLRQAVAENTAHRSRHRYDYREMGFTREQIVREFADIFDRFHFDRREPALEEKPHAPVPDLLRA